MVFIILSIHNLVLENTAVQSELVRDANVLLLQNLKFCKILIFYNYDEGSI